MPGVERKAVAKKKPEAANKGARPAARAAKGAAPQSNGNGKESAGETARVHDGRGKYVYCIIQAKNPLRFGPLALMRTCGPSSIPASIQVECA